MRIVLLGRLAKPKAGSPLLASDRQGMCTLHAGVMLCIVVARHTGQGWRDVCFKDCSGEFVNLVEILKG
jgi:hypothetical protein